MYILRICNPVATFGAKAVVSTFSSLLVFCFGYPHFESLFYYQKSNLVAPALSEDQML